MGKTRIIAETGAGQHGIAVAMVSALFGMKAEIYMGIEDINRQKLNVFRMELCGAKVIPVESSTNKGTLKDAVSESLRDFATNHHHTYYLLGTVAGPHPYPLIVRDFQKIIGEETKQQILNQTGRLPDKIIACVGGGSNAIGIFHDFKDDHRVQLIGVEPEDSDIKHGATLTKGCPGVFQGSYSYVLQDDNGQIKDAHSISAGLDYPGVGPEHAYLKESNRAHYETVTDSQAIIAMKTLSVCEGIIPALESSHALAYALKLNPNPNEIIIINISGRGDKDMYHVMDYIKKGETNV